MKEFIDYLERKIEGCDSLGGMEREKAIYQSVLKDYRKQFAISDVSGRSEQFSCPLPDARCDRHKIDDEEGRWEFCNTCKREWAR